jgi:hypothetical protein
MQDARGPESGQERAAYILRAAGDPSSQSSGSFTL